MAHWSAYLYVAPAAIARTYGHSFVVGAAVSLFAYRDGGFTFVEWPILTSSSPEIGR